MGGAPETSVVQLLSDESEGPNAAAKARSLIDDAITAAELEAETRITAGDSNAVTAASVVLARLWAMAGALPCCFLPLACWMFWLLYSSFECGGASRLSS